MNRCLKGKIVEKSGTQRGFAKAIGAHEAVVSRGIKIRRRLTEMEQQKWAQVLGADTGTLFGKEAAVAKPKLEKPAFAVTPDTWLYWDWPTCSLMAGRLPDQIFADPKAAVPIGKR